MSKMTNEELIGYCGIHCETPRALFHRDHIARMIALAGYPPDWPDPREGIDNWVKWSCQKETMRELVNLAKRNLYDELTDLTKETK